MSAGSSSGSRTGRWAGGRIRSASGRTGRRPARTPRARTRRSGSATRRRPSGVSSSGPWSTPSRTVLAPRRATLPHPLRTTCRPVGPVVGRSEASAVVRRPPVPPAGVRPGDRGRGHPADHSGPTGAPSRAVDARTGTRSGRWPPVPAVRSRARAPAARGRTPPVAARPSRARTASPRRWDAGAAVRLTPAGADGPTPGLRGRGEPEGVLGDMTPVYLGRCSTSGWSGRPLPARRASRTLVAGRAPRTRAATTMTARSPTRPAPTAPRPDRPPPGRRTGRSPPVGGVRRPPGPPPAPAGRPRGRGHLPLRHRHRHHRPGDLRWRPRPPPAPSPRRSDVATAAFVDVVDALQADVAAGDIAGRRVRRAGRPGRLRRVPGPRDRRTPINASTLDELADRRRARRVLRRPARRRAGPVGLRAAGRRRGRTGRPGAGGPVPAVPRAARSRGHRHGGRRPAHLGRRHRPARGARSSTPTSAWSTWTPPRPAAARAFADIEPLARLVDPALTADGGGPVRHARSPGGGPRAAGHHARHLGDGGGPPGPVPAAGRHRLDPRPAGRRARPLRHRRGPVVSRPDGPAPSAGASCWPGRASPPRPPWRPPPGSVAGAAAAAAGPMPRPPTRSTARTSRGIATPEQARMVFAAFDVTGDRRAGLADLLAALDRRRRADDRRSPLPGPRTPSPRRPTPARPSACRRRG